MNYELGDYVVFTVMGVNFEYKVTEEFLRHSYGDNDVIFRRLGIEDKMDFCERSYGYLPEHGGFPQYKFGDMVAANSVINDLKALCDTDLNIPMEDRLISKSLVEKIISIPDNGLIREFYKIYNTPAKESGIKNITINLGGKMTFLPKGKKSVLKTDGGIPVWAKDNRQEGKYGKILRKLLTENGVTEIVDSQLEQIVNSLKGHYIIEGKFKIVKGVDIEKYYRRDHYDDRVNTGTLEGSCMRHTDDIYIDSRDLYVRNENVEMVILKSPDGDVIRGRALLWTDKDGNKWMDRVYASDHVIKAFHHYSHNKGWPHKQDQDACSAIWTFPNGETRSQNITIPMDTYQEIYPYMDTFVWVGKGFVTNDSDLDYFFCAQEEPDSQDGRNRVWDCWDECNIHEEDAVYLEYRDEYTHSDNAFMCEVSGDYFLERDGVDLYHGGTVHVDEVGDEVVECDGRYYLRDQVRYCNYNEQDYPEDEVQYLPELEMDVHQDSVEDAYADAGFVQDDDCNWVHETELEETD